MILDRAGDGDWIGHIAKGKVYPAAKLAHGMAADDRLLATKSGYPVILLEQQASEQSAVLATDAENHGRARVRPGHCTSVRCVEARQRQNPSMGFPPSASVRAFTPIFAALWTRVNT